MEGTLATISMFAGTFAPRNWAYCNGQTISIQQNTALFSLLGTTYGGDGRTTFALPDLQGRAAVGAGTGPGLSNYALGQKTGNPTNTLTQNNLPQHIHGVDLAVQLPVNADGSNTDSPENTFPAPANDNMYATATDGSFAGPLDVQANLAPAGNGTPMNNMQPFLGMNYIICTAGIFPQRW